MALQRIALVSRDGLPYPRVLTGLLRAVLFAAAAIAVVLFVANQPGIGLITVSAR